MTGGWGWEEDKNNKRWMRIRMRMWTMMRMWIRMKMRMRIRMRIGMRIKMRIRMREGWKKKYSIKLTKPLLGSRTRAQSRKRRNVNLKHHFCKNNFVHKLPIQDINIKQYFFYWKNYFENLAPTQDPSCDWWIISVLDCDWTKYFKWPEFKTFVLWTSGSSIGLHLRINPVLDSPKSPGGQTRPAKLLMQ